MQVTVVGAGVIGLTTALTLEEHGHDVRVVAAAIEASTTSAVAGAVWFPYRAGPPERVVAWAARTRAWLEDEARDPEAGIDHLVGYEITNEPPDAPAPWWAANITVERVVAPVASAPLSGGAGRPLAWKFDAPRAEPARFLPHLARRLRHPIERRVVTDLAAERGDVVVDCTGLAARELARDPLIVPLLGQVVITDVGGVDRSTTVTDDRDPEALFYCIPRRDELVLGGCSRPHPPGEPAHLDDALTARILDHAVRLGLPIGAVRTVRVGLRPFRPTVRLERDPRDPRIVHNYGHGGAGFTLCRGCAEDVVALL
ncbi:MAG TPA: FAD-dependent oxidoreductase [Kofleriaceae bacterium]|nr:FAD-dependent oxidoreductase [Kofleriaceae bacterium]